MDISGSWKIEDVEGGQRLDRWLAGKLASGGTSRTLVVRMIDQGWVKVNGQEIKESNFKIRPGQTIECQNPAPKKALKKSELSAPELKVLYEDLSLAAVDKPAGLLTHPTSSLVFSSSAGLAANLGLGQEPSVLQWIEKKIKNFSKVPRFGIVHRLDEATSGILLIAKTTKAYERLVEAFQQRLIHKTYLALAWGQPVKLEGVVRLRIAKKYSPSGLRLFTHPEKGWEAETAYRVLRPYTETALFELKPTTGRTHQLRLHLKSLGHPVCGDPLYHRADGRKDFYSRLMLHAWKLEFKHPVSGKKLELESPLPADFLAEFKKHVQSAFPRSLLK